MKINYSEYNFKKIFYKDKEYEVSLIDYDETGIKLSFYGKKFLDEFDLDFKQHTLANLKCVTIDNSKMTLFNVGFTIRNSEKTGFFVHLLFNNVIYDFVDSYELKCNKLNVILDNKKYIINNFFKFNEVKLENDITLKLESNYFCFQRLKVINTDEIYSIFISFYEFFNLLVGFFPPIREMCYYLDDKKYRYVFDIPEKFITKQEYRKNDSFFTYAITKNEFLILFNKFNKLRNNMSLSFDIYYCSMMECTAYPEFSVVNILQSLDGMFYKLTIFEENWNLFDEKIKKKIIERYCEVNISDICDSATFDINRIKGLIGNIDRPSFSFKIKHYLNVYENLFKNEKNICTKNKKSYFEVLLEKFVNTRNKFSHVCESNKDYLNGTESALYIFKLHLLFRLCIMKEISMNINQILLDDYIFKLDNWINEILENEKE